jgi:hypothetical protein
MFQTYYEPSQLVEGIPSTVDPYLYDYALQLNLSPIDYQTMTNNIGYQYIHDSTFNSKLQKLMQNKKVNDFLLTAVETAADVALAPIDKALFDVAKLQLATCPNASSLVGCGLQTLSNALVLTRPTARQYIEAQLPLTAWLSDDPALVSTLSKYPAYVKMRNRIYESAIPRNSPLRWGANNGSKSGTLKPDWVVQLQQANKTKRTSFSWLPPL